MVVGLSCKGVSFGALDHNGREKLARHTLRPAISNERIRVLADGSIAYKLKNPMRTPSPTGGSIQCVVTPRN